MRMQEARKLFMQEVERRESVDPVDVGVIDTLFEEDHEDMKFAGVFYNCREEELLSWMSRFKRGSDNYNKLAHGTHVAGIIGAINNNGIGIDGAYPLAYDRKNNVSHLFACSRWLGTQQDDMEGKPVRRQNVIDGLQCLALLFENGVKVINYSMGLGMEGWDWLIHEDKNGAERKAYADIVGAYLQNKLDEGKDFVIVCSAGNDSHFLNSGIYTHDSVYNNYFSLIDHDKYPDVYDRIIVVGNCKTNRNREEQSNSGDRVDVWAVGKDIYSTMPMQGGEESSKYTTMTGTSQAAPYVTGTAAMVWTLSPEMTGSEVKKLIVDNSVISVPIQSNEYIHRETELRTYDEVYNGNSDETFLLKSPYEPGPGRNVLDAERAVQAAIERGGWGDGESRRPETETDAGAILKRYYRTYLMPKYGLAKKRAETIPGDLKLGDVVEGLLGYKIQDYDGDGQDEMIILRSEYDQTEHAHDLTYTLCLFEVSDTKQVVLQDNLVLEKAFQLDLTCYPSIQTGLFSYRFEGKPYFAWGLDAYSERRNHTGDDHVFRIGILTYNGRYLEEIQEAGFGNFSVSQRKETAGQTGCDHLSVLTKVGLACSNTQTGYRVRQNILIDEDMLLFSGFESHFHEMFTVLATAGSEKDSEDSRLIAEQNISLRMPTTEEPEMLDITVWPDNQEKITIPALDLEEKITEDPFREWLEKNVPNWDVVDTEDLWSFPESGEYPQRAGWDENDLSGYLAADIRDYDSDGTEELLLVRISAELGQYSQTHATAFLEMYEYEPATRDVELRAEKQVDISMMLLGDMLYRPEQFNVFTRQDGKEQVISLDIWETMNDTMTILAEYIYDGYTFEFRDGLSYEQYGEGDYVIRRAVGDPSDFSRENTIWTALYSTDLWQTVYEWYTYTHDDQLISAEELENFREIHKGLAAGMGVYTNEEIRSGFMAMTDLYEERAPRMDVSAGDVYSAIDGSLTNIASVILFTDSEAGNGRYVLHRRDWQGSLDAWRD